MNSTLDRILSIEYNSNVAALNVVLFKCCKATR